METQSLIIKKLTLPSWRFTSSDMKKRLKRGNITNDTSDFKDLSGKRETLAHTEPDEPLFAQQHKGLSISIENNHKFLPLSYKKNAIAKVDLVFGSKSLVPKVKRKRVKLLSLETSKVPRFRLQSRETGYNQSLYKSFFQSTEKIVESLQSSQQYTRGKPILINQSLLMSYPKKL